MASRPPKKRLPEQRLPEERTIQIRVDREHRFHYTEHQEGDASTITVVDGDSLKWVLDASIRNRTFQIDFGVVNPFHSGAPVSLRGIGHIVSDKVKFPANYTGNRILKYSVSLGNGWYDDPDVVPVPADTDQHPTSATFQPTCKISWARTAPESAISLDPADMTADATGSGGFAMVTWQWASGQHAQPFSLEFQDTVLHWPQEGNPVDSDGGNPSIILFLKKGPLSPTPFRITTMKVDGNDTWADGTLQIS